MKHATGIKFLFCFLAISFLISSCSHDLQFVSSESNKIRITDSVGVDSTLILMIQPYKKSLDAEMNEVIGICEKELTKEQPESTLGNFVADALLTESRKLYADSIDFAVVNYGGIRIPSMAEGNITLGKAFELMPFDNQIVIMTIKGNIAKQLCDAMAVAGGWPVSGISFQIKNGEAENILVNKKNISADQTYRIAISDYLANGGDQLDFLRTEERVYINMVFRDLIIEHIRLLNSQLKMISSELDHRIKNVE